MKQSVVVCGLMKNANHVFEKLLKNVYSIVRCFDNYKIVIVESNSTDGTKNCLLNAKAKDERLVVVNHDFDLSNNDFKNRELRIAVCRNIYLKAIYTDENIYDYIIVIDLDEIFSESFNTDNLKKCLELQTWDAMFANQTERYYDIWALRGLGVNYDCYDMLHKDRSADSYETKKRKYINSKQIQIPQNHPPIRVESAFGGLGVYKYKMIVDIKPMYKEIGGVCEHVEFHKQLINAGYSDLFIHPNLIIKSPNDESFNNYFK